MNLREISKYIVPGLVLTAFIAVALFGTFIMVKEAGHNGCLAARANNESCPISDRYFAYVNFHLNAAKTFSTGTIAALAVLGAALFLTALPAPVAAEPSPGGYTSYHVGNLSRVSSLTSFQKFTRWFSLKENAPNGA
ncbi:MAG: hypothetical protein V1656_02075 [Candidatus Jorgensenbacteria bacterium]